jgi:hypothetical protein
MKQLHKFVKLADKLIINQANNHVLPIVFIIFIKIMQFRMNSSLIINNNLKKICLTTEKIS